MSAPRGMTIVALALVANAALVAIVAASDGWSEAGVRQVVRSTAQLGVVLFGLAFAASSLRSFWRTPATAWLLRNRRYLGLSFAACHTLHLAALGALALYFPDPFVAELNVVTLVGGGLAYALLFAQVATSNDAAVRALGRRRWTLLHTVASYYLWILFAQSYFGRIPQDLFYVGPSLVLAATMGLRVARRLRKRAGTARPAGEAAH